jgi:hypothetical protein
MTAVALMLHGLVTALLEAKSTSATSSIATEVSYFSYPLHCSTARPRWSPSFGGGTDWDHDERRNGRGHWRKSDDVKRRTLGPSIHAGWHTPPTPTLGSPERYPSTL